MDIFSKYIMTLSNSKKSIGNFFRTLYFLFQIMVKTFFLETYFSKVSVLPGFKISITRVKTVSRLQSPVPVLLPLCQQIYLSFALVGNFYLLV